MSVAPAMTRRRHPEAGALSTHVRQTAWIAAPIAMALLAEMTMGLITTAMLGGLGPAALAAGGLATSIFFTGLLVLQGLLSGVGVLAATCLGAGKEHDVPAIYWTGVLLAVVLAVPMFAGLSLAGPLLRSLGEPGALADDIGYYLQILRWGVPAGVVGIGMMRQFLPAIGLQRVLLWVMPGGIVLHAGVTIWLIGGGFGLPAFGLAGSAAAIVVTLSAIAASMLALLHGGRFRRFVRTTPPQRAHFGQLLAIGVPVSVTVLVEAGLFLATGMLVGRFGAQVLAAHMVVLSVASTSFTVPMALSQAANVRVAGAIGAGRPAAARRAGFAAVGLSLGFMGGAALVLTLAPGTILHAFLGHTTPQNAPTLSVAVSLLGVAAVFQMADGTQVAAAGALRGLQDVRVPMLLATCGYWGGGFCVGWLLAFPGGLGAVGLWWGLCVGLILVAAGLTVRFAVHSGRLVRAAAGSGA